MNDEKLAQIKAALVLSVAEYGNQDAKDMLEIIERLEAAERCAGYLGSLAVLDTTMEVLLKEWRGLAK